MALVQYKLLALALSLLAATWRVNGVTCPGRPSLIADYTNSCKTKSSYADFAHSQSCLTHEIANNVKTCTPSDSCTEINVRLSAGQFADSDKMVWSFAGCYSQDMVLAMCSDGHNIETTTVPTTPSVATSPTTTGPPTTTPPATTTGPTTTDDVSSSTESDAAVTSTPPPTTVVTGTTPTLPTFAGCVTTTVSLNTLTCSAHEVSTVSATHYNDSALTINNGAMNVDVKVLGCCTDNNCRVDDSVARPNTCRYGDTTSSTTVNCVSDCYAYLKIVGSTTTGQFGCLSDVDLTDTSFSTITDCSGTHKDGTCTDANSETECLKCCSGSSCNTWTTKDSLLNKVSTESKAAGLLSSGFLIIAAFLINRCL